MIISPHAQGTTAWLEEKAGILGASELGELVKLNFDLRTGEMVQTLLARKLAERWNGPLLGFSSFATDQGNILEDEALPWLAFNYDVEISRPGFLMTDDKSFGSSPDGIISHTEDSEEMGLEVKCYQPVHVVKALLDGEVPKEHLAQIHGGMFVTGYKRWKFLSYHRSFPKLLLTVDRDEEIQKKIAVAVAEFKDRMEAGWKHLLDLNGGEPPPKREPMTFAHEFRSEMPT